MPVFEPPVYYGTPMAHPEVRGLAYRLLRHYRPLKKGITVIQQADGSWVAKEFPLQEELDAALRYYLGGHRYEVDLDEAALLTAAGYGAFIT